MAVGALALCATGFAFLEARFYQASQSARLARLAREASASRAGGSFAATDGGAWGRIEIPAAGVSALIADGLDARTLNHAVGHVPGSARPGQTGNVGLAGHRDGVFRGLRDVELGDVVRITTPTEAFEYTVEAITVVERNRTDVLDPAPGRVVTLVTCYPFSYVGRAPRRFVVRAREARAWARVSQSLR